MGSHWTEEEINYLNDSWGTISLKGIAKNLGRSIDVEPSPMIGGHPGGVIAYPIAIVKLNEKLKEVKLSDITF